MFYIKSFIFGNLINIYTSILLGLYLILLIFLFIKKDKYNLELVKLKPRNSLLELLRFVIAILILGYHDNFYHISPTFLFGNANIFIVFFFLISGYYVQNCFPKYDEYKLGKSLLFFIKDKLTKMGIPLLIAYLFTLANSLLEFNETHMIHTLILWYIHIMIIVETLYYLMHRLLKEKTIIKISVIILIIASLFKILSLYEIINTPIGPKHEINAFIFIPIGYLIKTCNININLNNKVKAILSFIIFIIAMILTFKSSTYLSPLNEIIVEYILLVLSFILIKDCTYNNNFLNILGKCSVYIYIYQAILRFIYGLLSDLSILFKDLNNECIMRSNIIFILTILTLIFTLFRRKKAST